MVILLVVEFITIAQINGMAEAVQINLQIPEELSGLRFPAALHRRLQHLLDLQDGGKLLTGEEREEAEGLVNLSELLTVLRLRIERIAGE